MATAVSPPVLVALRQLIPAYVPPAELEALAPGLPPASLVVVNPASGVGASPDPAYARACATLRGHGLCVLGYVATGWAGRGRGAIEGEARRYREWYDVDGIFFDEAPAGPDEHGALAAAVRESAGAGVVVLNPGRVPDRAYFDLADLVVTFEGPRADYDEAAAAVPDGVPARRTARLVYGVEAGDRAEVLSACPPGGVAYATAGEPPNPWATVCAAPHVGLPPAA